MLKVNCITFFALFLFLISCASIQEKNTTISPLADSSYQTMRFPEFKSSRLLYLNKTTYSTFGSFKNIDSLVAKKVLRGNSTFYTFLDSSGIPLSKNYDSVNLKTVDQLQLTRLLESYYVKDDRGSPKCGAQFQDAIVFYDSLAKPVGFIQICFGCGVFDFSESLHIDMEKCNTDSMINKFVFFFNKMGVKRSLLHSLPVN